MGYGARTRLPDISRQFVAGATLANLGAGLARPTLGSIAAAVACAVQRLASSR